MEFKDKNTKGKNLIFVVILISLLIASLIIISFLFSENRFVITKSIITLLCLLVVLVLSNSFEHIHFGKWFEISNQVREGNEKIKQLKDSTEELCLQIRNMNNQTMQISIGPDLLKPTNLSLQQKEQEEEKRINAKAELNKRLDIKLFQNLILSKYFGTGLRDKLQKNMSLVESSQNLDQISSREVSFDALLEDNNKLFFIDVLKGQTYGFYYDRIYVKLNKILCYTRATKKAAQLILLFPKNPEVEKGENRDSFFINNYTPAIQNNLLRIEYVDYSKTEYDSCLVEKNKDKRR